MAYYKIWWGNDEWTQFNYKAYLEVNDNGDLLVKDRAGSIVAIYAVGHWKHVELVE